MPSASSTPRHRAPRGPARDARTAGGHDARRPRGSAQPAPRPGRAGRTSVHGPQNFAGHPLRWSRRVRRSSFTVGNAHTELDSIAQHSQLSQGGTQSRTRVHLGTTSKDQLYRGSVYSEVCQVPWTFFAICIEWGWLLRCRTELKAGEKTRRIESCGAADSCVPIVPGEARRAGF